MSNSRDKDIAEAMANQVEPAQIKDKKPVVSNYTGYDCEGGENFEHDDTGAIMNYSGCEDDMNEALSEHEGWEEGYDY